MSLVEHFRELRRRIVISAIAIVIGGVVGYVWFNTSFFGLPALGEILRGPYCSLPKEIRADISSDGQCRLLATQPFEMFLIRLKVGGMAGVVLSFPVWMAQIWGFITPGLKKNERRITVTFLLLAVCFFVCGAVLSYLVVDRGLQFLLGIGKEYQVAALSGAEYFNLISSLIVIFGVSFEIPLVVAMLNIARILKYRYISGKRRAVWVLIFIFGALFSPGGEVTSMLALSFSVGILVELSFMFCKWNDRRVEKKERQESTNQLEDIEASPMPESSSEVESGSQIAPPTPIEELPKVQDTSATPPKVQKFSDLDDVL